MRATVSPLAFATAVLIAGCGEGRAILNVDVLSFFSASDSTKPYNVPGGVPPVDSTVQKMVLLPGVGRSIADSVSVTAAASLENTSGGGNVAFAIFFAKKQAWLFTGSPYVNAASGPVSGAQTVPLIPPTTVSLADTMFNTDTLWVAVRARISSNAGPNMVGRLRLIGIDLRVVAQENIF